MPEFGLEGMALILLIVCIASVCIFEFINGFHDTANAVATVIYTGTLKPQWAVVWSGIWNFLGVYVGGIGVALGIMKLLPLTDMMLQSFNENVCIITALMLAAILWNLGTWYFGIPCSSSHTMIGSLLGVGMVFYFLHGGSGVNWDKAKDIGLSLLVSPLFGFTAAIGLMFILRQVLNKGYRSHIFNEPEPGHRPPLWIRAILVTTCTLVSFFHGSNDGQKGVGLMMIVLLTFVPMKYALAPQFTPDDCIQTLANIETTLGKNGAEVAPIIAELNADLQHYKETADAKTKYTLRRDLQRFVKKMGTLHAEIDANTQKAINVELKKLKSYTDFAPTWVIMVIALCLGLGTMVGWKRIVITIGEKIGKRHMTYAEGATAELIAASTIGLSTGLGLPVSTTHVLSSGVAGSMVATKGVKNLQSNTVFNIALAWILTLPVTIVLAGGFYWIFQKLFV
ncbi:inorganic phosphate transporter [Sphingobacteriales bacterium UPWRP_1]|nr:anion permease [Sphingobacteriales bacterium TSM_CSM]PSJ78132.1 inorganic phosphate transporter [Sphingobacteriales bacterium UPWRP_1]